MSLLPIRQEGQVNISYPCPYTQEAGGILTFLQASGITFVQYAQDPKNTLPVGIQLNDIEWQNLTREFWRTITRRTDVPFSVVGISTQGDFRTDWLYIVGSLNPGDTAYVGPSGTITNSATIGGPKIGHFISDLEIFPHLVTMRGLGFSRQYTDIITKNLIFENNPADRILVPTPGYASIRVTQAAMILNTG